MFKFKTILVVIFIGFLNSCTPEAIPKDGLNPPNHISADTGDQDDEPEHRNGG